MRTTYRIVQYSEQLNNSKGVSAGMWALIETIETPVAFFDGKADAERIKTIMEQRASTNDGGAK